jgi:predicted PurR-regulated permease PerM
MLASAVVALAGMRAASPVIGPVLIALLITIAWSPASDWLRKRGLPSTLAALTGVLLSIVIIALLVLLVWSSVTQLQSNLPGYTERINEVRSSLNELLQRLPFDSSQLLSAESLQPGALVSRTLGVLGGITATAGNLTLLILIMAFMMIEAVRYPQKLHDAIATSGASGQQFTAFAGSMRSYVVINTIFGLIAAVSNTVFLMIVGVDFALLWGVLSFFLSFLPNVGFLLAMAPPALLALLQFGVGKAVIVLVGFSVINTILDTLIKPRFLGESLDISPAVVVISLVFWGWLLGPVGAVLAVPLSLAARFLFESFDDVRWLAHLISDADAGDRADRGATDSS